MLPSEVELRLKKIGKVRNRSPNTGTDTGALSETQFLQDKTCHTLFL